MSDFTLHIGDCREVLKTLPEASVDSIVCDPPYGLSREPDMAEVLRHWLAGDDYTHTGGGFMGKAWDSFVPGPAVWREALRVLKPGGHVLAFSGTRTYDMAVLAMRLAGFEVRDQLAWVYGSGMPKSLNVAKAIESGGGRPEDIRRMAMGDDYKPSGRGRVNYDHGGGSAMNGETGPWEPTSNDGRRWAGWGTALKPSWEPIVLARKPLRGTVAANVLAHGTGGLNIEACRIATGGEVLREGAGTTWATMHQHEGRGRDGKASADRRYGGRGGTNFAMKPGPRGGDPSGRWPANLLHDGSDEVLVHFPSDAGASAPVRGTEPSAASTGIVTGLRERVAGVFHADTGSAARFFYCGKATTAEREAGLDDLELREAGTWDSTSQRGRQDNPKRRNHHPTVKPIAVGRWLQRLITPPGGVTLDLYAGSGTFGMSAILEGFHPILIELDRDADGAPLGYEAIIRARMAWALEERDRERVAREVAAREAAFRAAQTDLFATA
jgi:site-specific DNA-methyltransferase (adenine-specific)